MITKFLTDVTTRFNPFSIRAKTARSFLALLPPDARNTMKVNVTVLPKQSQEKPSLAVTFKDGKKMDLDLENLKIKDVQEEVDRHSRKLARQDELKNG